MPNVMGETLQRDLTLKELAKEMREELKLSEKVARAYTEDLKKQGATGEAIAQSILAMRHIEDARMRYGKVIQYLDDENAESCYDK